MSDNDYGGSYSEGRSGQMYSGGNSIDYAGYQAGRDAAFQAELSRSGSSTYGSGGSAVATTPMTLTQKAMRLGVIFGLIGLPLGALWETSVLGAVVGVLGGFAVGMVVRFSGELVVWPFKRLLGTAGFLPAVALGFLGGTALGGPTAGVALAAVLLIVWTVRHRRA